MTQRPQHTSEIRSAVHATRPEQTSREQSLYTVAQHAEVEPAFTESALRNLIFKADSRHASNGVIPGNGMIESGALVRIGRKVLIHRAKFLEWVQR